MGASAIVLRLVRVQELPDSMITCTVKATKMAMPHNRAAKISFRVLMAGTAYRAALGSTPLAVRHWTAVLGVRRADPDAVEGAHPMRDALGALESVLVLGGGSDIALATVKELAKGRTRTVILAGRDPAKLEPVADELRAAGVTTVELFEFDAAQPATHQAVIDGVWAAHPDLDLVLLAFGVLGDQDAFDDDPAAAADAAIVNYAGAVSCGLAVAQHLKVQGHGTLAVITSVAGERARADNFVYGSTKAGLDAFTQGLGDRLAGTGASVMAVRPGFVRTSMTEHLSDGPMATTVDAVAKDIVAGLRRGAHTVWSPAKLQYVFAVLKVLPRPVWRKLAAQR